MRIFLLTIFICVSTPLYAASGQFFSLKNTDFVVLCSFLLFIGILFYFKVPGLLGGMLDKRSDGIRKEIDEARALRDDGGYCIPMVLYVDAMSVFAAITATYIKHPAEKGLLSHVQFVRELLDSGVLTLDYVQIGSLPIFYQLRRR